MAIQDNWENVTNYSSKRKNSEKKETINFLKIERNKTYTIRPVGGVSKPYYKYILNNGNGWRFAICEDPSTCPVALKHNIEPSKFYAINVIDREDGQLKVLESKPSVFVELKKYKEMTGEEPGGVNGADFTILKSGKEKSTRYETNMLSRTKFTAEEVKIIRKGLYKLDDIFKPTPVDKIEDVLFGEGKKANTSNKQVVEDTNPDEEVTLDNSELNF